MVGVCLIAVFAIAAVTTTSASALPEWGKCVAKAGGKYTDGNCTTKGKGGTFEWKKGATLAPQKFSGENIGSGGVLTTYPRRCVKGAGAIANSRTTRADCAAKGGEEEGAPGQPEAETLFVECGSEYNEGYAEGKNRLNGVAVKFKDCGLFAKALPCQNTANSGEIVVNLLAGSLGYINKASKEVGVLLEPQKKHGEFAKFDCGGLSTIVVGGGNSKEGAFYEPESKGGWDGVISPITPVNTMTHEFTQVFTINPETAENIPSKFEGKHIELLEDYTVPNSNPTKGSMWSPAGQEITNRNYLCDNSEHFSGCNKDEAEGEIKA